VLYVFEILNILMLLFYLKIIDNSRSRRISNITFFDASTAAVFQTSCFKVFPLLRISDFLSAFPFSKNRARRSLSILKIVLYFVSMYKITLALKNEKFFVKTSSKETVILTKFIYELFQLFSSNIV